jgi:hypothetical protein
MPKSSHPLVQAIRCLACLAVVMLAACEQSRMLSPSQAPSAAATARATLNCTVSFGAAHTVSSFRCGAPGQAPIDMLAKSRVKAALAPISKTRVVITSTNEVSFATSNFSYVANIFSFDATITNLMTQPLGTTDGVNPTPQGTRAVVVHGPAAAGGTGTVTVAADSGTMTLTAANQPFWQYDAIIRPDSTSPPSNWKFGVPSTVTSITFQIEVTAAIPAEASVLRWLVLRQGLTDSTLSGVWRNTSSDIYAVGNGGAVLHYDGTAWSTVAAGLTTTLNSVFGFSATDVWAVGKAFTAHFNGAAWAAVANPGGMLFGVWGSGTADVYAVGTTILHNPGTGWVAQTSPTTRTLRSVWGSDAAHVWAVGDTGTIVFNDGTGTWVTQPSCTTNNLRSVWGASATSVYAVGAAGTACFFDGTTWTSVNVGTGTNVFLEAVGGSAATDVWVVSPNGLLSHFNGTAWSQSQAPVGTTLLGVTSGSASSVAIVGNHGTLLNFNGTSFVLAPNAGLPMFGIYATDTNNIFASSVGTIFHYNGTSWTSTFAGAGDQFRAISGTGDSDIYAVGNQGSVTHFNGTSWVKFFLGGGFNGVWDIPNQNTIYVVGGAGVIKKGSTFNAGSFSTIAPANPGADLTAVWADNGDDIFVVDSSGNISHATAAGVFTDQSSLGVPLRAIHGLNGVDQWAVGAGGNAFRLIGPNPTWTAIPTATTNILRGVWDAAGGDVYAVGDGGAIEHWNGVRWSTLASPVTTTLHAVHGTAQAHIYVGGDNGVILFGTR